MSLFIAISGNIGSGKTTLSKIISGGLRFKYLPEERPEIYYLDDLFSNPPRWSFEAQISFLCSKADNIKKSLNSGFNIVLDRSIYEDINIFAKYFYTQGHMNDRAYQTYFSTANNILETLPLPDLIINCSCSPESCLKRLSSRKARTFEKLYPKDFIYDLASLYQEWLTSFNLCPIYLIDTENYDTNKQNIYKKIFNDIRLIFQGDKTFENTLFDIQDDSSIKNKELSLLESVNKLDVIRTNIPASILNPKVQKIVSKKIVYIAAPFTQYSKNVVKDNISAPQVSLDFSSDMPHGEIVDEIYKKSLLSIDNTFKKFGLETILPHRDINKWGKKMLEPEDVVKMCRESVLQADLFFAIFGTSLGVHYEAGIAAAFNRPMIIARVKEIKDSFFAKGITYSDKAIVIKCNTISELPNHLKSKDIINFLQKYIY